MIKDSETPLPMQSSGVVVPEGVSFDGVTDYLSRSTDLVGNVDSKQFTFSCWVYWTDSATGMYIYDTRGIGGIRISITTTGIIFIIGENSAGSIVLNANTSSSVAKNTFSNIKISINLNNTLDRYIAINDIIDSSVWSTYSNDFIKLTMSDHLIASTVALQKTKGRLSNLFIAREYIDLSVEENRRIFITADGKPADGLASLNPILYLPMTDASTAHVNLGTGGNFVQNGTLATADRGANQDNCVQSKFDGVDDYLEKLTTISPNTKVFTASFNFSAITNSYIFESEALYIRKDTTQGIYIAAYSGGSPVLSCYIQPVNVLLRNYSVSISIDMDNQANCKAMVNGVSTSIVFDTFTVGATINQAITKYRIARSVYGSFINASVGELYFDTVHMPLDVYNPFWIED